MRSSAAFHFAWRTSGCETCRLRASAKRLAHAAFRPRGKHLKYIMTNGQHSTEQCVDDRSRQYGLPMQVLCPADRTLRVCRATKECYVSRAMSTTLSFAASPPDRFRCKSKQCCRETSFWPQSFNATSATIQPKHQGARTRPRPGQSRRQCPALVFLIRAPLSPPRSTTISAAPNSRVFLPCDQRHGSFPTMFGWRMPLH
jgi:hypothetical protein